MGLNVALISFVPATQIASASVNANFASINTAPSFVGGVPTMNFDGGKITSDGNGNIKCSSTLGMNSVHDIIDWSTASNTYIHPPTGSTGIFFQIGTPGSGTPVINMLSITASGITINPNSLLGLDSGLVFQTGSISRSSTFSGNASGVYNHGNNGVPSVCLPMTHGTTSNHNGAAMGFTSATATQVYIAVEFSNPFLVWAIAF